jgi:putative ABC transport system permease protein
MFYNYLKIALRGLQKQKQFALLNFFGLTLGICIAGLLLLYVLDELSFDKYHKNLDQIYRVIVNVDWEGEKEKWISFYARSCYS